MPANPAPFTPESAKRRSLRVLLSVPVVARGTLPGGKKFEEETRTLVVNAHGALIALAAPLKPGQVLLLVHQATQEERECKVVYVGNPQGGKVQMGVEFLKAAPRFWHIDFPPDDWTAPEP